MLLLVLAALSGGGAEPPASAAAPYPIPSRTVPPRPVPTPSPKEDPEEADRRRRKEDEKRAREADTVCESLFHTATFDANAGNLGAAKARLSEILSSYSQTRYFSENRSAIEDLLAKVREEEAAPPDASGPILHRPAKDLDALRVAYEKRRRSLAGEGQRRLEEARKAVERDRAEEEARLSEQLRRVGNRRLTVTLKGGLTLHNIAVKRLTRDGVRLTYLFEGAEVESEMAWDLMDDRSYVSIQRAILEADGAAGFYEIGRRCVSRKLWKDAKSAFESCVRLDDSYRQRVPDLGRVLNQEGAFKGISRRVGRDRLVLTYDFSDPDQVGDFDPLAGGRFSGANGSATITPEGIGLWTLLRDLEFEGDVAVEARVSLREDSALVLGAMFSWDCKGYLLVISPTGSALVRIDGELPEHPPAPNRELGVSGDVDLRFRAREGRFTVAADGREVFSTVDATYTRGRLLLGGLGRSIVLRKLVIDGRVNPAEIDKRFAEAEVLARRALEGDLLAADGDGPREDRVLTLEDEFFLAQLGNEARDDFEDGRKKVRRMERMGGMTGHEADFPEILGRVIERHPGFPAARYWRGYGLLLLGRFEEARRDLEEAARHPDFPEARAAMAELWFHRYDFPRARAAVEEALRSAPHFAPAISLRGHLKFIASDVKGAMADFEVALRLDPSNGEIRARQRQIANVVKGPEYLGCKHRRETAHYIVLTDISPERTRFYADLLEAGWRHYAETFREFHKGDPSRPKPRIAIFNTREAFYTYSELTNSDRNEDALGYFTYLNNELILFEEVDLQATMETLWHEAFHQFMSTMIARPPYWYNEGIAEYMSANRFEKGRLVETGRVLEGRLRQLQMGLSEAVPFEELMKQSPAEFYSGPASFKYAQAWSMIQFFYRQEGGRHRALLDSYFRALLEGKDIEGAYDAAFGRTDMDRLQAEWRRFVGTLKPPKK